MNKYINIIIFTFFGLMVSNYNLGLTFYVPIVIYLGLKNEKNLILIFVVSTIAIYFNTTKELISVILFSILIVIYKIITIKNNKISINIPFSFICSILTYGLSNGFEDILLILLYAMISSFFLAYLYFNQDNAFNMKNSFGGFSYNELLMAIIATAGATSLSIQGINLGLSCAIYFGMYFASSKHYGKTAFFILLATISMKYIFHIDESFMILFVSCIYLFPKLIATIVLFAFSLFLLSAKIEIVSETLIQGIMIIGLFFEVFRAFLINDDNEEIVLSNVYENVINNVNNETVSFASFLDSVNKDLSFTKEYNNKVKETINNLYKAHCEGCNIRKECLSKNKGKVYFYYKNLINNNNVEDFGCPNYYEMKRSAFVIANKYNILDNNMKNEALSLVTMGLSTILRQYTIDSTLKSEINYSMLNEIKKDLIEYGLTISLFDVKSAFAENFLIEVGVTGVEYKEIEHAVKKICNNYIENGVSIIYKRSEKNKIYFNIVPKLNFDVVYGYGALAPLGNNVCGDNYLVKHLNNSKIMAAISDGMGKGIDANLYSSLTLRMLDEITNMNIMTDTALQIINTLIHIQDFQEVYSTLDFVEINRQKGEGQFYKAGGSTTYLFHSNGDCEKIENENLPFGLDEIINVKTVKFQDNDLIIMASDGVFENVVNSKDFEQYIMGIRNMDPQKLIYELLNYTRYTDVISKDDMSIIALKIKACES